MSVLSNARLGFLSVFFAMMLVLSKQTLAEQPDDGLIRLQSPHTAEETAKRFEQAVRDKGLKVFPRFDHGAAATEYAQTLPSNIVIVFGNPRYGSPLMAQHPAAGIDFPPKAIVYEDAEGQVWLAYNSAEYFYHTIFKRHGLPYTKKEVIGFAKALDSLATYAISNTNESDSQ